MVYTTAMVAPENKKARRTMLDTVKNLPPHVQMGMAVPAHSLRFGAMKYVSWLAIPAVIFLSLFGNGKPVNTTTIVYTSVVGVVVFMMVLFFQRIAYEEGIARRAGKSSYQLVLHGPEAVLPAIMLFVIVSPFVLITGIIAVVVAIRSGLSWLGKLSHLN